MRKEMFKLEYKYGRIANTEHNRKQRPKEKRPPSLHDDEI